VKIRFQSSRAKNMVGNNPKTEKEIYTNIPPASNNPQPSNSSTANSTTSFASPTYTLACKNEQADRKSARPDAVFYATGIIAKSTAGRSRLSARSTTLHTMAIIGDMSMFIEIWSRERGFWERRRRGRR
jgi:hypothetical protein